MHKIDWCEVGMQLADIGTNNVIELDLTPRMKYCMVRLENTCAIGVIDYRIVYGTRVLYDQTIFSSGLQTFQTD